MSSPSPAAINGRYHRRIPALLFPATTNKYPDRQIRSLTGPVSARQSR
jgi:hypothetical protein